MDSWLKSLQENAFMKLWFAKWQLHVFCSGPNVLKMDKIIFFFRLHLCRRRNTTTTPDPSCLLRWMWPWVAEWLRNWSMAWTRSPQVGQGHGKVKVTQYLNYSKLQSQLLAQMDLAIGLLHGQDYNREINSLLFSEAVRRHRSGSVLALVMACCLKAPSH